MDALCIGVHVHSRPEQLQATLDSLAEAAPKAPVLLLADGPDAETTSALAARPPLAALACSATALPRGAAACFNRLAAWRPARRLLFVESGTVVAPDCVERLLAALEPPGRGLAGPSTNRAWNEQGVFDGAGGSLSAVRRSAAQARRRFGAAVRSLEPLLSLSDFCFAVRAEVVDAVGAADEAYGVGPCWEMDLNVRAARAGWRGVWVGAAYAYRHPATDRRQREEAARMAASRRLYQDRFCGLRLDSSASGYHDHCLGEACEHFAPPERIRVHLPSAGASAGPVSGVAIPAPTVSHPDAAPAGDGSAGTGSAAAASADVASRSGPAVAPTRRPPLVSCVMVTRDRPELALQAVRYFQAQSYPRTELVILEDGPPVLAGRLPRDPRIRHLATGAAARSIGALRNEACAVTRGEVIAHFDDDDWHGPERLAAQVAPIVADEADITALRDTVMLDLSDWRFWRLRDDLHRRLFVRDVHGGTLVYRRRVWEEKATFPDRSLAEDALFLDAAVRRGARLRPVAAEGLFVYVRHDANAWQLRCGVTGGPAGWRPVAEPELPAADRAFYARRATTAVPPSAGDPLVSCIMPTYDRRPFVAQAVEYFLRQEHPAKELVVVDDGPEPVADLLPEDRRIVYRRLERRTVLGAKRNLACDLARGHVIVHWDDDDWSAPHRLATQLAALADGADLCGARSLLYYDPAAAQAWRFGWPVAHRAWAAGATLAYPRSVWARSPFPELAVGEDTRFVWGPGVTTVADVGDRDCVVGIVHRANTAPKAVHGPHWTPRPVSEVHDLLGDDVEFYRRLATSTQPASNSQDSPMDLRAEPHHNGVAAGPRGGPGSAAAGIVAVRTG
jgi:glycosyltransferase involved in cell wall biosynthesis